ncbi:Ataxin-3 [Ceratobasidium sp. AG-Ba]|nr:Ataxin-3 [Ceratobasidium sp. AG-Ba]
MIDVPATIAFITTVRPYIEPYAEPLLWRGISWFIGNAERPSDAVREVEQFKAKQREKEGEVTEALGPYMYHERQEPGSMLCGQHALNTLLQGSYFTAPDLARIVKDHPEIEENADKDPSGVRKTNLETGYFSVQTLNKALKETFGLTLTKWRSPEMRIFQAHPDTQLAFVLNLEQHWFTLRRFGQRGGKGFWFNLNSFLSAPEWVGGEYLKMVLQQAEQEGYTIFVARPSDPSNPEHGLPETETDILAETLDESAQSPPLLPDITGGSRLV